MKKLKTKNGDAQQNRSGREVCGVSVPAVWRQYKQHTVICFIALTVLSSSAGELFYKGYADCSLRSQ